MSTPLKKSSKCTMRQALPSHRCLYYLSFLSVHLGLMLCADPRCIINLFVPHVYILYTHQHIVLSFMHVVTKMRLQKLPVLSSAPFKIFMAVTKNLNQSPFNAHIVDFAQQKCLLRKTKNLFCLFICYLVGFSSGLVLMKQLLYKASCRTIKASKSQ